MDEETQEEGWMQDLRTTMKANQALLEKLLEERSQPLSHREAFIRFLSDTLRSVSDEQYSVMHELIMDILRQGIRTLRDSGPDTQGPSSSGARPGPSRSAPPTCTSTSQPYFSHTYSQQQQYYQPHPNYDHSSNCQYGGGIQQQQVPQQHHPQQHHQQVTLEPLQTPVRTRESAESVGRLLASSIGEEWSV